MLSVLSKLPMSESSFPLSTSASPKSSSSSSGWIVFSVIVTVLLVGTVVAFIVSTLNAQKYKIAMQNLSEAAANFALFGTQDNEKMLACINALKAASTNFRPGNCVTSRLLKSLNIKKASIAARQYSVIMQQGPGPNATYAHALVSAIAQGKPIPVVTSDVTLTPQDISWITEFGNVVVTIEKDATMCMKSAAHLSPACNL